MQFFILVLLICLFVFLFCVYLLANDDFIFLRRDVTMERLFNIIFAGSLFSLLFSRIFYGLFNSANIFSNPFVFLLFPYFPGLSLLGGIAGIALYFLFLSRNKKNSLPILRMSDFFSIALSITIPIGFLGYFMFSEDGASSMKIINQIAVYLILFFVFLKFLLHWLLKNKLKEGTITFLFLLFFSLVSLISNIFPKFAISDYFKNLENPILILIFFLSAGALFVHEKLLLRISLPAMLRKALQAGQLKKGR